MIPEKLKGISAGLLASSIWGGMFVVSKVLLDVIPPFALLTGRLVLGILVLGAVLALRRGLSMTRQQMWQVLGVGVIGYGVSIGLQNIGTKLSTAANGSLVTMAAPLFVFLFGWWLLGEAISPRRLAALLVATVGVIAVIQPGGA
ncbi:MAG: DMT family transporter, partial [Anaerolineae bacterium]|nr:DMT family transporter [Anaerolineae bacterium]